VIVDADAVEARLFAANSESSDLGQGQTDWNPESDTDTRHLTTYLIAVSSSQ